MYKKVEIELTQRQARKVQELRMEAEMTGRRYYLLGDVSRDSLLTLRLIDQAEYDLFGSAVQQIQERWKLVEKEGKDE